MSNVFAGLDGCHPVRQVEFLELLAREAVPEAQHVVRAGSHQLVLLVDVETYDVSLMIGLAAFELEDAAALVTGRLRHECHLTFGAASGDPVAR